MCKLVTVGDMIQGKIELFDWSTREFATRMGISEYTAKRLIQDRIRIDEEYALRLMRVIGGSVVFWIALDEFNEKQKKRERFCENSLSMGQKVFSFCSVSCC